LIKLRKFSNIEKFFKKIGVYGFYVDLRVSGNFRSDPAFASSFLEDPDMLLIKINKLVLHGFSCSKGRVKRGMVIISSSSHFFHTSLMPQVDGL